jgi:hypothetical protein
LKTRNQRRPKQPKTEIKIMKNRNIAFIAILLALACFALLPEALATDLGGVLPGNNTADGTGVLISLTSGTDNSGFGFSALTHDSSGNGNTADGVNALNTNTTGNFNTATGQGSLRSNNGSYNTATGYQALYHDTTGNSNTGSGYQTLFANGTGANNAAFGYVALYNNTSNFNTAIGSLALYRNTDGFANTATGYQALYNNTSRGPGRGVGLYNTANGVQALFNNEIGVGNTAVGYQALSYNRFGSRNTAMGDSALPAAAGSDNTALGVLAGENVTTANNVICLGTTGANVSNSCYVGNIWNQSGGSQAVYVNSDGKLGALVSSRRFKDEIKPMDQASEVVYSLQPVTFRYKKEIDPEGIPQFGLVAEDVARVNPDLVTRDADGKVYTVRYEAVNAMLLNEFLKEHLRVQEQNRKIQEQDATITQLKKEMGTVVARLKEQASQIQKVNDQLELRKPAPQTVLNNQ